MRLLRHISLVPKMSTSTGHDQQTTFQYTILQINYPYIQAASSTSITSRQYLETPYHFPTTGHAVKHQCDEAHLPRTIKAVGSYANEVLKTNVSNSHRHGPAGVSRFPLAARTNQSFTSSSTSFPMNSNDKSRSNFSKIARHPQVPIVPSNDISIPTSDSKSMLL